MPVGLPEMLHICAGHDDDGQVRPGRVAYAHRMWGGVARQTWVARGGVFFCVGGPDGDLALAPPIRSLTAPGRFGSAGGCPNKHDA